MSDSPQTAEDIVADALANGLHAVGVEAVVLLSLKAGKVTRRIYGDPKKALAMAVRWGAEIMRETAESYVAEEEEEQA
jgi:hypothetical protein